MDDRYDRTSEDLGNIVALEHLNTRVPDQRLATIFYITGMGFTRDPYLTTGVNNMWINVGRSQFHLPTGEPQVIPGHVGLVLPDREALLGRLTNVKAELDGTRFSVTEHEDFVEVSSPWGNVLRCYEPSDHFGNINLGMPRVEFDVPPGTAAPIARFYREVFLTHTETREEATGAVAACSVGYRQEFVFRETDRPIPEYDHHHVQIYLADFSSPYRALQGRGLVTEESNQWQYRFENIIDLDTGDVVLTLEHEVRSMTHPLHGRPLVNRDPSLSLGSFALGHEDWRWHTFADD